MLCTLVLVVLSATLSLCQYSPNFQEEYRNCYVPDFTETSFGRQIVAPDTPYVAAVGQSTLYFIDTRFSLDAAAHIKAHIEAATVPKPDEYLYIDEIEATAELRNATSGETTFIFNPPYARLMFAESINRRNPALQLPEHSPAGDMEIDYDPPTSDELAKGPCFREKSLPNADFLKCVNKEKAERNCGIAGSKYYHDMSETRKWPRPGRYTEARR